MSDNKDNLPIFVIKNNKVNNYEDNEIRLNNVLKSFDLNDTREEMINIRKKQILNHSYVEEILDTLEGMGNIVGSRMSEDNKNYLKYLNDNLLDIHCPIYSYEYVQPLSSPIHVPFGKKYWREWNIEQIFRAYDLLIEEKNWSDYYTRKQLYENPKECKEYMVYDMVNDLFIHRKILNFNRDDFTDSLLSWDFENDKKINIKINPSEKEYYLLNDCSLDIKFPKGFKL